jgi:hypothetical protein
MKEKIQQKLLVWGQLYKQCEQLEQHLRSATSKDRDESGPYPAAIQAELKVLKAQTQAAFKDASEALEWSKTQTPKSPASHDAR